MAVSTLRPQSKRRKLCVGILAVLGLLSQAQVLRCRISVDVASTSWVDCFKQSLCSSPGEDPVNCYTLLGSWPCDDAIARECAPSIGNFTCSLYAAQNGHGTCLMDDPEFEVTTTVPCHHLADKYDLEALIAPRTDTSTSVDATKLKGKWATAHGCTADLQGNTYQEMHTRRSYETALYRPGTQPKCRATTYQGSFHSCSHQMADWKQGAYYLLNTWTSVQSASQRLGQSQLWTLSLTRDASSTFFRTDYQKRLLHHLDTIGEFCQRKSRQIQGPTLSASKFLPQKGVWGFAKRARYVQPSPAEYTVLPKALSDATKPDESPETGTLYDVDVATDQMAKQLAYWAILARDFDRQNTMPGLRSGNTVIDERNFSMS